ncbi:YetF domain-containing protein [Hyphomicrobium sp. CS1GBMeth3]|uniref:DUF421 domain-containing protein n=1 Tax=Hyphomicrobium sp. CS1GBMeth3 TaxID=1892845 RepID=UPI0009314D89|nr:YetF domain-containing protein [Hyphomicrobium sp. CS1GBMeth3]
MSIDWSGIFVPSLGLLEVFVRGTIIYLAMFAILRFGARRQAGQFGPADLLVIVLIADAAQNGLGKEYGSVTEAIVLVLTIVFWEYVIDWLKWRVPALRSVLTAPPLTLVENGRVVPAALRHESLTEDELMGQLREREVEDVRDVKLARLEGDGRISVLKNK